MSVQQASGLRGMPLPRPDLDTAPFWFQPVFRNGSVAVYRVT